MLGDTSFLSEWLIGGIVWTRKQQIWVASTLSRAGLIRLEKQGWVFLRTLHGPLNPKPHEDGTPVRPHKVSYKVRWPDCWVLAWGHCSITTWTEMHCRISTFSKIIISR